MASWLKAAEGLFEVVDRRAKLVVSELSDEQSDFPSPAPNGRGSQEQRTKPKAQKILSKNEPLKISDTVDELTSVQILQVDSTPKIEKATPSFKNDETTSSNIPFEASTEQQDSSDRDAPRKATSLSEMGPNNSIEHDGNHALVSASMINEDAVAPNGDLVKENTSDVHEGYLPSPSTGIKVDVVNEDRPVAGEQSISLDDAEVSTKIDQEKLHPIPDNTPSKVDQGKLEHEAEIAPSSKEIQLKDAGQKRGAQLDEKKQKGHKRDASPKKIEEQLDEAQGLLKTTVSTGSSKEARLARVCAGLSSRLQEYKSENSQLEELLIAERELSKSYEARIKQLQQDLSLSKMELSRVESSMVEALTAKNSEIEALINSMDALKKQAALSEGNLASLQANMESIMRNRELTETRMMQALREELASAERRGEEERAAHNATKMAAMEREVELEHRAVESSTALARAQRIADERTAKATELEQKVALLEAECASLNQELQDMEVRARRSQKKSPEETNQVLQMQAWQEEVERARQAQREAESKLSSMEAEVQKMRVEMAAMKRDAEHYSRQEHMELEKRYRELTDLLYYKQTQLEAMASEKAAAEFQLEKELKRLQEAQVEAERTRASRRVSTSWEEDTDMKALEPLPLHHRHMAGASIQLQKAAKLLDSGAVRATRFLWRYPVARVLLLFYLVFVHLFLMYLLHRLQEQADTFASREFAESMGLATPSLP